MATAEPDSDIKHCDKKMSQKNTNAIRFNLLTYGRLCWRAETIRQKSSVS